MELSKFCIFLLILVLLSLGFVSASEDSDVFEPLNDSFVDNCSDFVFDENSSYYISDDGVVYQKSKVVISYGTIDSALVTMYGNTEKELMNELYLFTCSEIIWCLIDKNEDKIWNL